MSELGHADSGVSPEDAFRRARFAVEMENRKDDEVVELAASAVGHVDDAVLLLAGVHRRRGEIDQARALLEAHLATNDGVPFALGVLLQFDVRDLEGAKAAYRTAFERGDALGAYNLAYLVADEDGGEMEAAEWLRRAGEAGSAVARADLASRGVGEVEEGADDGPEPWVADYYPADLVPWIIADSNLDPMFEPLFVVADDKPFPSGGQVARAARLDLQIRLMPTEQELDLHTLAAGIPDLRNLDIEQRARVTGLSALAEARSLVELSLGIRGDESVDLSALPALRSASVMGANFLSVCRNPNVEWLGLGLPRPTQVPTIDAPIRELSMTAKHAGVVLERIAHPELLESMTLFGARDLDLDVLRRFPNVRKLDLSWCNGMVNAAALADLAALHELEVYRCRNVDDVAAIMRVQARLRGEGDEATVAGPFFLFEDDEEEGGRFDLSTGSSGWEGVAESFADRILGFSGYRMEKLVVTIAKEAGVWSRGIERDSEAEALHLIFPEREGAVAVAEAAWAVFRDAERLDAALQSARLRVSR